MSNIFALLFFVFGMGIYRYYFPDFGIIQSAISGAIFSVFGFCIGYLIDFIKKKISKNKSNEVAVTNDVFPEQAVRTKYYGFGGWLIIFLVGLVYQFYGDLKTAYVNYNFTKSNEFSDLITPGKDTFNSFWEITIYFEIIAALLLSILTVMILWFLVRKSKHFRLFSIIFISLMLATNLIDLLFMLAIQNSYTERLFEHPYDGTYKSLMYAVVWIPYLLFSRRVKNTYTN